MRFSCPQCGTVYEADNDWIGRKVACEVCTHKFYIEEQTPEEAGFPKTDNQPSVWITCPHCWQKFDVKDVKYISRHLDLIGDPVAGGDAQQRFIPTHYSARGMAIDAMGMECFEIACPHCHLKIPEQVTCRPSSIFSVVGAPASGKSYLLTTMLWQLRKMLPNKFGYTLSDVDSSFNSNLNHYEELLFMNKHPDVPVSLPKTELQGSGYTNQIMMKNLAVDLPKPFIFSLSPTSGNARAQTAENRELERNIILYDNAGEHFQPGHESVNNLATSHLACSDGIIFVFDPLLDMRMMKYCDSSDPQFKSDAANQLSLFFEMTSRVRLFSGLTPQDRYGQPLIIAIAKFDVLKEKFDIDIEQNDYIIYDSGKMEYSLDIGVITDVSYRLREKMLDIAPEFVSAAEGFSDTVYFVPVSSFGCSPEIMDNQMPGVSSGKQALGIVPSRIKPFWAEVPMLMQLYLHGLLRGSETCSRDALPIEQYKFTEESVIFSFPGVHKRCELPRNYWGMQVFCKENKQYYQIPAPGDFHKDNFFKASSLEEQLDSDFWFDN